MGFVVTVGNTLGPLVVWLIKKDESQFDNENVGESLKFQIPWTIWIVLSAFSILLDIGLVLLPVVTLVWVVVEIFATAGVSDGEVYDYPLTVDLIS